MMLFYTIDVIDHDFMKVQKWNECILENSSNDDANATQSLYEIRLTSPKSSTMLCVWVGGRRRREERRREDAKRRCCAKDGEDRGTKEMNQNKSVSIIVLHYILDVVLHNDFSMKWKHCTTQRIEHHRNDEKKDGDIMMLLNTIDVSDHDFIKMRTWNQYILENSSNDGANTTESSYEIWLTSPNGSTNVSHLSGK